jgi:hypothetical protein
MTQIHRIQFMGKLIRHASILAIMTLIFMAGTFWAYAHELDKVLNLLQASAILLALFLLSLLALKDEGLRYKTDPDSFGYQRYKNLLKSSRASHKDQASYDVFDHEGLVSRSLLEDWPLQKSLIASGSTILDVEFRVTDAAGKDGDFKTRTRPYSLTSLAQVDSNLKSMMLEMELFFHEKELYKSGLTVKKVKGMTMHYGVYKPLAGAAYLPLPECLASTRSCVHVQNDDKYCFKYCMLCAVHKVYDKHNAFRPSKYTELLEKRQCEV